MQNELIGRQAIKDKYLRLLNSNSKDTNQAWIDFKNTVILDYESDAPVAELSLLPKIIERKFLKVPKHNISILSHGCGSGMPDLYWIALGYSNLISVDIFSVEKEKKFHRLNNILKIVKESKKNIFLIYDGSTLPVKTGQIDVVSSNAVVEHLSDEFYENYFCDEARVLKKGGIALHVIPQRRQPFDSHTQTWFIHWLPKSLQLPLVKIFGRYNADLVLQLRSRYTHLKKLKDKIGEIDDLSVDYFMTSKVKIGDFYDGKLKRGLVFKICNLPGFRIFLPHILKPLLCLISVTTKTQHQTSAD